MEMTYTDHDLRRQAILHQDCSVSNKIEYLEAVKAHNIAFRSANPRIWMQYVRETAHPSLEKLSMTSDQKMPKGKPCGLVMVWIKDNVLVVTGSVLHGSDKWNKHLAMFYAINRIDPAIVNEMNGTFDPKKLPKKCFDTAATLVDEYLEKNREV